MRALVILAFVTLASAPALAADPADPGTIAWNNKIAMHSPNIDGVFVVQDDGTIRHVQSGMICPATFANVKLWHLETFPSPRGKGMDVSCDYGRNGPNNRFVSKLTLFATIAPDGATLDRAFAAYRAEVIQANPGVRSEGPLPLPPKVTLSGEWKSESFLERRDDRAFTSELIVALRGQWMFEVRATYDGSRGDPMVTMQSSPADATNAQDDRTMAATAFAATVNTLLK
jgi:hypothetical protein